MSDPGLVILPTHRLVSGFPGLTADRLRSALGSHFAVSPATTGRDAWESIELDGTASCLGMYTKADGKWLTARLTNPGLMTELASEHSPAWRNLAVSILHVAVLGRLLPKSTDSTSSCRYVHLLSEVEAAIAAGDCDLAVLVPPASMADVARIAGSHEKMPPKSTYFYPKLLTGLVFNSLKSN
jgi:uncharacterized protein (DUF1015 family)